MGIIAMRNLEHNELELIWTIDRGECVSSIYQFRNGELVKVPAVFDIKDWPAAEREHHSAEFLDIFARGGSFIGAFDDAQLVGIAVLDVLFRGSEGDQLQLTFLHVSCKYRRQGLGKALFERVSSKAREREAKYIYVSATPSENTVEFYQGRGCVLASPPDPELLKLEPEDIHFVCPL